MREEPDNNLLGRYPGIQPLSDSSQSEGESCTDGVLCAALNSSKHYDRNLYMSFAGEGITYLRKETISFFIEND